MDCSYVLFYYQFLYLRCEEDYDGNSGAAANILEVSQVPGINPLHLHPEMFTEKQIPKLDDLISITSEEAMETEL